MILLVDTDFLLGNIQLVFLQKCPNTDFPPECGKGLFTYFLYLYKYRPEIQISFVVHTYFVLDHNVRSAFQLMSSKVGGMNLICQLNGHNKSRYCTL